MILQSMVIRFYTASDGFVMREGGVIESLTMSPPPFLAIKQIRAKRTARLLLDIVTSLVVHFPAAAPKSQGENCLLSSASLRKDCPCLILLLQVDNKPAVSLAF